MVFQSGSFKQTQLQHNRVKTAYTEKEVTVKNYFQQKGITYHGFSMFLRAFKKERKLEVWVKEKSGETFSLLQSYDFCATSGRLGPKRKEGDLQIPEGIYDINHFNPVSNFYLSLGINYPNSSDKILSDKRHPGGSIYIHGNCVTIGCIPITDDKIKELYVLAVEAKNNGQTKIPVHIFPTRLNMDELSMLRNEFRDLPGVIKFWEELQPVYLDFEKSRKINPIKVSLNGKYSLN
jgi:murein L,D-transpeptidase YafK